MAHKKQGSKLEYKKYRVRGHIRSFRDLEVYKKTTELSSQIFTLELPKNLKNRSLLESELAILRTISKQVPRMIAEAYGDRFTNFDLGCAKLEKAAQYISNTITKLDFLVTSTTHQETKNHLVKLIKNYQRQRTKTLNLKRAWIRAEEKYQKRKQE